MQIEHSHHANSARHEFADDVCALPLVRRLAAMLDHDPKSWKDGDPLPRGWHVLFFVSDTRQSDLRIDGVSTLGIPIPDVGLPRLMMGGKRTYFESDIPIGAKLSRSSRVMTLKPKEGQSGKFVVMTIEHQIALLGSSQPVIVEECDYIFREAAKGETKPTLRQSQSNNQASTASVERSFHPDETLLFRYSALTYNAHRIHFDRPYAEVVEGYRGLVVNGGLTALFLLELFRETASRQPARFSTRNIRPLICGIPIQLKGRSEDNDWVLWAEDEQGERALEATAQ
jgi:3-methylfumaryl-CoA hydratase